jgi:hypothetical protein
MQGIPQATSKSCIAIAIVELGLSAQVLSKQFQPKLQQSYWPTEIDLLAIQPAHCSAHV